MVRIESLQPAIEHSGWTIEEGGGSSDRQPLRSPGQLPKHYAPKAKLVVWNWRDEADLASQISNFKFPIQTTHILAHTRIPSPIGFGRVTTMRSEERRVGKGCRS